MGIENVEYNRFIYLFLLVVIIIENILMMIHFFLIDNPSDNTIIIPNIDPIVLQQCNFNSIHFVFYLFIIDFVFNVLVQICHSIFHRMLFFFFSFCQKQTSFFLFYSLDYLSCSTSIHTTYDYLILIINTRFKIYLLVVGIWKAQKLFNNCHEVFLSIYRWN